LRGVLYNKYMKIDVKNKKTAEELQDDIFRKMPTGKKINLACRLAGFCLKLNSLRKKDNGNIRSGKTALRDN